MGDNLESPFMDVESGDEEIERPPTPDFHHGEDAEEEKSPNGSEYSEISGDGDQQAPEEDKTAQEEADNSVTEGETPNTVDDKDVESEKEQSDSEVEENKDNTEDNNVVSPASSVLSENEKQEEAEDKHSPDMDVAGDSPALSLDNDVNDESNEAPIQSPESDNEIENEVDNSKLDTETNSKLGKDQELDLVESSDHKTEGELGKDDTLGDAEEDDDDDLEMAMSPIGDLGLSGTETAIVDDILKGDVSHMLPDHDDKGVEGEGSKDDDVEDERNDDDNDDVGERKKKTSSRAVISDDEEEAGPSQTSVDKDDEGSEPEEAGDQLIADIFGASDEEEEFEGFDQEDIEVTKKKKGVLESKKPKSAVISDDETEKEPGENDATNTMVVPKPDDDKGDSSDSDVEGSGSQVWDFDVMMEKKKASKTKRRRKGDGDIISDNDDLVVEMIKQMKQAAEEDRLSNEAKQAATKKLKLLPVILKHMNKADLQFTFIDSGVLGVLKEWLSPLPDGSMPHLQIRTGLLKILSSFPGLDTGALKMSGLGKAIMYIYRHPKEVRQNRQIAGKLINDWARPIFGVTSNFKSLSREEREERDYQNMSKRRRLSSTDGEGGKTPRSIDSALQGEKKALRPGDKGFVMRARVPMPSNKDYVVRPKSDIEGMDFSRSSKKTMSRADKQMKKFKENNKSKSAQRAVTISVEGRHMSL